MLTTNFSTIEWKNGAIENPTYFIASNLNAINKSTKDAIDELEKEITGNSPLYSILSVYKSLNLFPDENNNNAVNPKGRLENSVVGTNSIGIGLDNIASGNNSIAIGVNAKATAEGAVALGQILGADNAGAIHIGKTLIPSNDYSISLGYLESSLEGEQFGKASISIGKNAKGLAENSVQLGEGSNTISDSLQFLNQNIYRVEFITDETTQSTITSNIFGAPAAKNVLNKFLGNAEGASKTLGEGESVRQIEDIFEEKSAVVKYSTNAINSIPVGKEDSTTFKKIYYDEILNTLHTNITESEDEEKVENIKRELLLYKNSDPFNNRHNIINGEKIEIAANPEGNNFNIKSGDLIKISIKDFTTYASNDTYENGEYELLLRIDAAVENSEYRTTFTNSYYDPELNKFICKSCRLACQIKKQLASFYFISGGIFSLSTGIGNKKIDNSGDYPAIVSIIKVL